MREVKTFFTEGNRLNKGYVADAESQNDNEGDVIGKKITQNLPSADTLAAYEAMHPGTFAKLVAMIEKEQLHRQKAEFANTEMQARASSMGRLFGLLIVSAICFTTFELTKIGMASEALIFAALGFTGIFGISALSYFRSSNRSFNDRRRHNNHKGHQNNNPQRAPREAASEDSAAQTSRTPYKGNNNNRRRRR
jgi:uncharacterized membrane protein